MNKSYCKGVEKYNSGDYQGAIAEFDNEIKHFARFTDPYVYRGQAKYRLGDRDGALEDWLKAVELGNDYVHKLIEKHFG